MLEGLRKPTELIVIVVTLLAYGWEVASYWEARLGSMSQRWLLGEIEQQCNVNACRKRSSNQAR